MELNDNIRELERRFFISWGVPKDPQGPPQCYICPARNKSQCLEVCPTDYAVLEDYIYEKLLDTLIISSLEISKVYTELSAGRIKVEYLFILNDYAISEPESDEDEPLIISASSIKEGILKSFIELKKLFDVNEEYVYADEKERIEEELKELFQRCYEE